MITIELVQQMMSATTMHSAAATIVSLNRGKNEDAVKAAFETMKHAEERMQQALHQFEVNIIESVKTKG